MVRSKGYQLPSLEWMNSTNINMSWDQDFQDEYASRNTFTDNYQVKKNFMYDYVSLTQNFALRGYPHSIIIMPFEEDIFEINQSQPFHYIFSRGRGRSSIFEDRIIGSIQIMTPGFAERYKETYRIQKGQKENNDPWEKIKKQYPITSNILKKIKSHRSETNQLKWHELSRIFSCFFEQQCLKKWREHISEIFLGLSKSR